MFLFSTIRIAGIFQSFQLKMILWTNMILWGLYSRWIKEGGYPSFLNEMNLAITGWDREEFKVGGVGGEGGDGGVGVDMGVGVTTYPGINDTWWKFWQMHLATN